MATLIAPSFFPTITNGRFHAFSQSSMAPFFNRFAIISSIWLPNAWVGVVGVAIYVQH